MAAAADQAEIIDMHPIAQGGLTAVVVQKDCSVVPLSADFLPVNFCGWVKRFLQVSEVACCAYRAVEQFFRFGCLGGVPCVCGVLDQGLGWFLK